MTADPTRSTPGFTKQHALIFVTITVFIDVVGFGVIMPVLPGLLVELSGEDLASASKWGGWLIVSYAALQFLFAPVLGNLSDRYGRRPLLLISLVLYGVNYLIAGLATSLWVLFVGRALTGIAGSTYSVANALIADVSPPEERAQNFGLLGMAFGLGFIFGPTLGGVLSGWDLRAPFYFAALLAFCNATYGYFVLKETLQKEHRRPFDIARANPVGALQQISKYPMLIGMLLAIFIYNIGHHVYPTNWNFYTIAKFDWTPLDIGLSMGLVGVLMAFVQGFLTGKVIPRLGEIRCAVIGMTFASIAFLGYAFATEGWMLYAWMIPGALGGFTFPSIQGLLSKQIPANAQGELQGALGAVSSLVSILAPPVLTQLFGYYTAPENPVYFPGAAFVAAAGIAMAATAVFLLVARPRLGASARG